MTDTSDVEAASLRLQRALKALEEAAERHVETHADLARARTVQADQIHALDIDRARLADELDVETAQVRSLADANRDVASRLDRAIATIRTVLADDPRHDRE